MESSVLTPELSGASAYYVAGDDHLRLTSFNAEASVVLALEGRFMDLNGRVVAFAERHLPNTDRTAATSLHTLGEGYLLNATVRVSSGSPQQSQCFVLLELVRGRTGAIQPLACLLQGYVSAALRLAWPGTSPLGSLEGQGHARQVTGTDPAAGAECSDTVPTGARWRLLEARYTLVTDATVANRRVTLQIDDGANIIHAIEASADQAASLTRNYYAWAAGVLNGATGNLFHLGIPPRLLLPAGFRIRTSTSGLQAGDNFGAPQILVEEWIEPA